MFLVRVNTTQNPKFTVTRRWHLRRHHLLFLVLFCLCVLTGPDHDTGLLPRSLSVIFNSIDGRLYSRSDLKPQRCRDFSRLTPDQQAAESSSKKNLMRLLKEVRQRIQAQIQTLCRAVMGTSVAALCLYRATKAWRLEDQLFLKVSFFILTVRVWTFFLLYYFTTFYIGSQAFSTASYSHTHNNTFSVSWN